MRINTLTPRRSLCTSIARAAHGTGRSPNTFRAVGIKRTRTLLKRYNIKVENIVKNKEVIKGYLPFYKV